MKKRDPVLLTIYVDQMLDVLAKYDASRRDPKYSTSGLEFQLATAIDYFLDLYVKDKQQRARLDARKAMDTIEKTLEEAARLKRQIERT